MPRTPRPGWCGRRPARIRRLRCPHRYGGSACSFPLRQVGIQTRSVADEFSALAATFGELHGHGEIVGVHAEHPVRVVEVNPDGDPALRTALVDGFADGIAWIRTLGVHCADAVPILRYGRAAGSDTGGLYHYASPAGSPPHWSSVWPPPMRRPDIGEPFRA